MYLLSYLLALQMLHTKFGKDWFTCAYEADIIRQWTSTNSNRSPE